MNPPARATRPCRVAHPERAAPALGREYRMSMVGRFNDTLYFDAGDSNSLNVAGTLLCGTDDAGKEVRIAATISQNGASQPCHDDFTIEADGSLDWTMPVSTNDIKEGTPATGTATAT